MRCFRAFALVIVLNIALPSFGQVNTWLLPSDQTGDWHDPSNWSLNQADDFWEAVIANGGVVELDGDAKIGFMQLGIESPGTLHVYSGELEATEFFYVGSQQGGNGTLQIDGGGIKTDFLQIGYIGGVGHTTLSNGTVKSRMMILGTNESTGSTFVQDGGTLTGRTPDERTEVVIGQSSFGEHTYELNAGAVLAQDVFVAGGGFRQRGGVLDVESRIVIASTQDKVVTLEALGGSVSARAIQMGVNDGGTAGPEFTQRDASIRVESLYVNGGTFTIDSGSELVADEITLAQNSQSSALGRFMQNGGSIHANEFRIDRGASLELNGGRMNAHSIRALDGNLVVRSPITAPRLSIEKGSLSVDGAEVVASQLLSLGIEGAPVTIDLHDSPSVIRTGIGAEVVIGPNVKVENAAQSSLIIGRDAFVSALPHVLSGFGELQQHDAVIAFPNSIIVVRSGQRVQLGNDGVALPGIVTDGFAYDSPIHGVTFILGDFQVGPNAEVRFDSRKSAVFVRDTRDAGVSGGTAKLYSLNIGGHDGTTKFVVGNQGNLQTQQLDVTDEQEFQFRSGNLEVGSAFISSNAEFRQLGGVAEFNTLNFGRDRYSRGSRGRGRISGGDLRAEQLVVESSGSFEQVDGNVTAGLLGIADGRYTLRGGELNITRELRNYSNEGTFDFARQDGTLNIESGFLAVGSRQFFRNGSNATINIDEHSLVLLPAGMSPSNLAGTVNNQGLVQRGTSRLTIPADRDIRGSGDLSDFPITVHGRLTAEEPSSGIEISRFRIEQDAVVDLGVYGRAFVSNTGSASSVTGGTLRSATLTLFEDSSFKQAGGVVDIGRLTMRRGSTYQMDGGELVFRELRQNTVIDLTESFAQIRLGEFGFLDLADTQFTDSFLASFESEPNSLVRVDSRNRLDDIFGSVDIEGVLDVLGEPVIVPPSTALSGQLRFFDDVENHGVLSPGHGIGGMEFDRELIQSDSSYLIIQIVDHSDTSDAHDIVHVGGAAKLAGTLDLQLGDSFVPMVGDEYKIISGVNSGRFHTVRFPPIFPALKWTVEYQPHQVSVSVANRQEGIDDPIGDLNDNGVLDAGDVDVLTRKLHENDYFIAYDLNADGLLDAEDRNVLLEDHFRTTFGDANLDRRFSSEDFVNVFKAGEYEDGIVGNSTWATGDWNGDLEFDSGDFVVAFKAGQYETSQVANVPEPQWSCLFVVLWSTFAAQSLQLRKQP